MIFEEEIFNLQTRHVDPKRQRDSDQRYTHRAHYFTDDVTGIPT
jgi:hypothetical protein